MNEELQLILNVDEMLEVWRKKCQNLLDKVKKAQLNWIK